MKVSVTLDIVDALAVGTSMRMMAHTRIPDPETAAAYDRVGTAMAAAAKAETKPVSGDLATAWARIGGGE